MKTLLVFKKSMYQIYFLERRKPPFSWENLTGEEQRLYVNSHEKNQHAIESIKACLKKAKWPFHPVYRARQADYSGYELVLTVGGDGTLLEAARRVRAQRVLSINSEPETSVGKLCSTDIHHFDEIFEQIRSENARIRKLNRLQVTVNGVQLAFLALNDLLICPPNPAALGKFEITVDGQSEVQRASGLWVSTAAGSTGAIHSAGGRKLPLESRKIQFVHRELFKGSGQDYKIKKGVTKGSISIRSLMREGKIYMDGARLSFPFSFGDQLEISCSPWPLSLYELMVSGSSGLKINPG